VQNAREAAQKQGFAVTHDPTSAKSTDVIINIDEKQMALDAEVLETVLGDLDGQLSLKNAVTIVEGV
jgi:ABC-type lipoprotein export system ATPase subunit